MTPSRDQVVLIDVGNAETVIGWLGAAGGEAIEHVVRLATRVDRTADEYGALTLPLFRHLDRDPRATRAVVVASVVPPLDRVIRAFSERYLDCQALFVAAGVKTGLPIRHDHPGEVGADRIVNALAARERHGAPVVVVDSGTATTFDVVDATGAFVGGVIAPGLEPSAEALFAGASKLYRVDLKRPDEVVGRNTPAAVQSGIYHGYLGLVDGILGRLFEEVSGLDQAVVTGPRAQLLAGGSRHRLQVDADLTLHGLRLIYERNRRAAERPAVRTLS